MEYNIDDLLKMFIEEELLDDRREYSTEDLMGAYPGLTEEQAGALEKLIIDAVEEKWERR